MTQYITCYEWYHIDCISNEPDDEDYQCERCNTNQERIKRKSAFYL